MQAVKDDWAEELSGYQANPSAIGHALGLLPAGKPPTVQDFKVLCRGAPRSDDLALPAPPLPPGKLKDNMAAVAAVMTKDDASKSGKQWAHDLAKRVANKEIVPTQFQRACIKAVLQPESES